MSGSAEAKATAKVLADQVWADIKHRAAAAGAALRDEAKNPKLAVTTAGVGALVGFLASIEDIKNAKVVKEHWWLLPLAILALGYFLHRKRNPHAKAILAVGGALFIQAFNNRPKDQANAPATTKPATETSGPADPFALHPLDNGYAWLQSPNGQLVRVQLAPMLRQFGPLLNTYSAAAPAPDAAARLAAAAFG